MEYFGEMISEVELQKLSPKEAVSFQKELRNQILIKPLQTKISTIGGADVSFSKSSPNRFFATIVVLSYQNMEVIERAYADVESNFPYIPGLLSFREIPSLVTAYKKLKVKPDAIIVDGHGIAHPRRMGIATHLGLVINKPTLGCAKKKLVGDYIEPEPEQGSLSTLTHKSELIGYAYRSRTRVKPVFISPGHLMDFHAALELAQHCFRGYRLPEPTRQAHLYANEIRRELLQ